MIALLRRSVIGMQGRGENDCSNRTDGFLPGNLEDTFQQASSGKEQQNGRCCLPAKLLHGQPFRNPGKSRKAAATGGKMSALDAKILIVPGWKKRESRGKASIIPAKAANRA
jgi:hypothetical protein